VTELSAVVQSLGAAAVIDYTTGAGPDVGQPDDAIFDAVGKIPRSFRAALHPGGRFVSVKATTRERAEDLRYLTELLERRAIRPVIDRTFPLNPIREAHRYVEAGHKRGSVLIRISA
jgi:NADPH:quinone reductase-like Zn-dependent oxidoreductase